MSQKSEGYAAGNNFDRFSFPRLLLYDSFA